VQFPIESRRVLRGPVEEEVSLRIKKEGGKDSEKIKRIRARRRG